ncbi:ATP-dependent DNA helicase RecQ [Muriicola jejuensis]|uniref:ATP-dependent DNA helicase RecQ n=1 Tax=Muriicola jejuensis TaxID=504488 RepID=A0A6P0UDZ3_9FLAO|nr:ATP-dependent DNA helicase RecQ [Muriicola jejuensis]NER11491.1 RecQ family ATP-dependent DNA helicase [Muriicola jejuensis]SMP20327.1 ATP-dependent DNA helicase RecQ [Muriicola jejuensis]
MNSSPAEILQSYWGHNAFRGSQEEIINAVLEGRDVLAMLPTGGGKSICYQVPGLILDGVCIVVSPLIALIRDQVTGLKRKGIKAVALTGGISFDEASILLDNCLYGGYRFLYLSPERLQQSWVQERISQMNINLIAIDEAHCISQWGIDFRPAYLECSALRDLHPEVPCIALTATATERVAGDITDNLRMTSPAVFKDSFERENLIYRVVKHENKRQQVLQLCRQESRSAIVYVRSRRRTEELSRELIRDGIRACAFHGGLTRNEKDDRLKDWLQDRIKVMVATSAFGMGIDKADVGLVVHFELPESLESYFQEAGRAGRNGDRAEAVLLLNPEDEQRLYQQFISVLPDVAFVRELYKRLNNYFQIAYGRQEEESFPFNFNDFCEVYSLNPSLVYNGLRLLDQNSVIALTQNFSHKTSVYFKASKGEIFDYLNTHPGKARILQALLRTYGGVFEFETSINPVLLARKAEVSEDEVLAVLRKAGADGLLEFRNEQRDTEITFLVPREDDLTINTFAHKIKDLNSIKVQNVEAVLGYVRNDSLCRSIQLLRYFGEVSARPCGECDVCRKKKPASKEELKRLDNDILRLVRERALTSQNLVETLGRERDIVLKELRYLLEEGKIGLTSNNEYTALL